MATVLNARERRQRRHKRRRRTHDISAGLDVASELALGNSIGIDSLHIDSKAIMTDAGWNVLATVTSLRALYLRFNGSFSSGCTPDVVLKCITALTSLAFLSVTVNSNIMCTRQIVLTLAPFIDQLGLIASDISRPADDFIIEVIKRTTRLKYLSFYDPNPAVDLLDSLPSTLTNLTVSFHHGPIPADRAAALDRLFRRTKEPVSLTLYVGQMPRSLLQTVLGYCAEVSSDLQKSSVEEALRENLRTQPTFDTQIECSLEATGWIDEFYDNYRAVIDLVAEQLPVTGLPELVASMTL